MQPCGTRGLLFLFTGSIPRYSTTLSLLQGCEARMKWGRFHEQLARKNKL